MDSASQPLLEDVATLVRQELLLRLLRPAPSPASTAPTSAADAGSGVGVAFSDAKVKRGPPLEANGASMPRPTRSANRMDSPCTGARAVPTLRNSCSDPVMVNGVVVSKPVLTTGTASSRKFTNASRSPWFGYVTPLITS